MDTFFPSEIARLVLGYLKEEKCFKSYHTFLRENSSLREYFTLYQKGKVYSTNVNGYSLLDILNDYCILKSSTDILSTDSLSKVCECPNSNNSSSKDIAENLPTRPNCDELKTANQKANDNVVQQNTKINELRHEINLSNNSNALQTKSLKDNITEETDTNDQSMITVPESETNSSYTQVPFVNPGTFVQSAVNKMPFSYPQNNILQFCKPSNELHSHSPFSGVFNTPSASSGTIPTTPSLTVPNFLTNTVNNFSSPLLSENVGTEVDKIQLTPSVSPNNEISTASSVGVPESLEQEDILETEIDDRVLKTSVRTNSKNSRIAEVSKGGNFPNKKGMKKKIKNSLVPKDQLIPTPKAGISSLLDLKGKHSSKGKCNSSNSQSKAQKATKRERNEGKKDKECKKKKKSDKDILKVKIVKPKTKNSSTHSVYNKQPSPQHEVKYDLDPSNKIAKTISEPKNGNFWQSSGTRAVSPFSTSHSNFNNSTVMESSFSDVKKGRVLKVVLSDIFKGKFPKQ